VGKLSIVLQALSTREAEAGRSSVQGQCRLHNKTLSQRKGAILNWHFISYTTVYKGKEAMSTGVYCRDGELQTLSEKIQTLPFTA
jgi:hypothetical protein